MPHDLNGQLLKVGDKVSVPCEVINISSEGEEYCNVMLRTIHPMKPTNDSNTMALNASQVIKAEE